MRPGRAAAGSGDRPPPLAAAALLGGGAMPVRRRALRARFLPLLPLLLLLPLLAAPPAAAAAAAASPAPAAPARGRDAALPAAADGAYNPSLALYRGAGWFVVRTTRLRWDASGLKWILNRAQLCTAPAAALLAGAAAGAPAPAPARCWPFDPWRGRHVECRWGTAARPPPWEASGVDDTKLFVWPGRGLWAVTGRRPAPARAGEPWCPQPVVWSQFLVRVAPEGRDVDPEPFAAPQSDPANVTWAAVQPPARGGRGRRRRRALAAAAGAAGAANASAAGDAWERAAAAGEPIELRIADRARVYGRRYNLYEKNWMPWAGGGGRLYVTYALAPRHRVYELAASGEATPVADTDSMPVFAAALGAAAAKRLHGGPPLARVPAGARAGAPAEHYLGAAHHWAPRGAGGRGRRYAHYLYRMDARAPFAVAAVSAELPLRTNDRYRGVAFASGLFWDERAARLLVSYGAGDAEARVLELSAREVDDLFAAGAAAPPPPERDVDAAG